jgi:hypothetical protein
VVVFAKLEPFLTEMREKFGSQQTLQHLEKLVMNMPNAKERLTTTRERIKTIIAARAEAAAKAQAGG